MTQTPSTFHLTAASEAFLDWIDDGGVPMSDRRFDTATMLRQIEAEARADAEATIARLQAVLEALWVAVTNDGDETTLTLAAEDAEAALSDTPAQDYPPSQIARLREVGLRWLQATGDDEAAERALIAAMKDFVDGSDTPAQDTLALDLMREAQDRNGRLLEQQSQIARLREALLIIFDAAEARPDIRHWARQALSDTPAQDYGLRSEIEKPWREGLTAIEAHVESARWIESARWGTRSQHLDEAVAIARSLLATPSPQEEK